MKKTSKASALLVASVFVLSGCGSSGGNSESASAETKSASATPTPTVGQEQYTAEDLEAALTAVKENEGLAGQIIPDAALRAQVEGATDLLEGVVITPEQCDVLATADVTKALDSANVVMMQLSTTDLVSVVSRTEASATEAEAEKQKQLMDDCSEFQMEVAGQVITTSTKPLEAATVAENTQAFSSTVNAAGTTTESIQVSGVSGTTNITVSMTNPTDLDEAVGRAEALISLLFAELEAK